MNRQPPLREEFGALDAGKEADIRKIQGLCADGLFGRNRIQARGKGAACGRKRDQPGNQRAPRVPANIAGRCIR